MGQILHGSATTTHAVRAAIQQSQAAIKELAAQYGLDPKTVAKWKERAFVHDAPVGPKQVRSSVLTQDEEANAVAFRKHTLLPLDDYLYALQATIPHLTRSSLHRCYQRRGISRLPDIDGEKQPKKKFKAYPIGFFHLDIAEARTGEGKLHLFVAIDRTSKFAFAKLLDKANAWTASAFLDALVEVVPYRDSNSPRRSELLYQLGRYFSSTHRLLNGRRNALAAVCPSREPPHTTRQTR